jgi:hypothetical protein
VLYEEFGKYGPIDEALVVRDKVTTKSRGFGFVRFRNAEDAQRAKEATDGESLDGRVVRVDFASEKKRMPMNGEFGGAGMGMGMAGSGAFFGGGMRQGPGMVPYGGMMDMNGHPMGYVSGPPFMQEAMGMQQMYPGGMYVPHSAGMYGFPPSPQQQQQFMAMQQHQPFGQYPTVPQGGQSQGMYGGYQPQQQQQSHGQATTESNGTNGINGSGIKGDDFNGTDGDATLEQDNPSAL